MGWLDELPREAELQWPQLCLTHALMMVWRNHFEAAETLVQDVVNGIQSLTDQKRDDILGHIAAIRAAATNIQGDALRAMGFAQEALEYLLGDNFRARGLSLGILGDINRASGDVTLGIRAYAEATTILQAAEQRVPTLIAFSYLGQLQITPGQLNQAQQTFQQALRLAEEWGAQKFPSLGVVYINWGKLLYEHNDLDAAGHHLKEGIDDNSYSQQYFRQAIGSHAGRATDPSINGVVRQRPDWLDETLFPFQSHYLEIEGSRIHYVDEGSGPVLLFLHASPAWSFLYHNLIRGLRDHFRCIALDYPGFGLSQAALGYRNTLTGNSRLVERFIQAFDLTEVTPNVHDASCAIGLGVVGRRPEWFRALVISNSFAWPLDDYPSIVRFLKIVASPFFGILINKFDFFTRYFVKSLNGGRLSEAEKRAYRGPFGHRAARRVQQELFSSILRSHDYLVDLEQRLLALDDIPALLDFGTEDAAYKAGWLDRFRNMFPRHRSLVLAGADHFPQEHDPAQIVAVIREWWQDDATN